jgi:hypothetical protein
VLVVQEANLIIMQGTQLEQVVQEVLVQFVLFGLVIQDNSHQPALAHHK